MRSDHRDLLPAGRTGRLIFKRLVPFALLLAVAGRLAAAESGPATTPSASLTGRLNVEGDAIEQVFLGKVESDGTVDVQKAVVLRHPSRQVAIPAGPYALLKIVLKGGYVHVIPLQRIEGKVRLPRDAERLTIRPATHALKVGLPLTAGAAGGPPGTMIQLLYGLYDAQIAVLRRKKRDKTPQFSASCDGREIASGVSPI